MVQLILLEPRNLVLLFNINPTTERDLLFLWDLTPTSSSSESAGPEIPDMTAVIINPPPRYFNVSSPAEYVAHVEINRPEKLNAFSPPMWTELRHIFQQLSVNPDLRAIIISGAGEKAFTAGKIVATKPEICSLMALKDWM